MSAFTRLGSSLWEWEPFTQLEAGPQILWMGLYTTAEAKRVMPGLWHGSITTMADACRKPVDETRIYLDALLDAELVEFDIKLRVLRMTQLPDAGESPPNGNVLRSWWRRFTTVPACAVRDAHVPLVRWMMDTWSRENGKPISHGHEEAWKETFGRVVVPAPRKRGIRRLAESDTSTPLQPSLFSRPETVHQVPAREVHALPEGRSVDNSDSLHQLNEINSPETVTDTVPERSGSGSGLGSGSGSLNSEIRGAQGFAPIAVAPPPRPEPTGDRDREPHDDGDPVDLLLAMFSGVYGGAWKLTGLPQRAQVADQLERLGDIDFALLLRWMRSRATGSAAGRELLEVPGRLVWAVGESVRWQQSEDDRRDRAVAMKAELNRSLAAVGLAGV